MNVYSARQAQRETPAFDRRTRLRTEMPVIVIGAVNMDLSGTPADRLRPGDSNPGRITLSPGGVGRNIAENLKRLGRSVSLVTVMGEDLYAGVIREHCRKVGIDLQYALTDPRSRTSAYLCINEQNGDLNAAIADMEICEGLTPDRLSPLLPVLNHAALVIADANLPEETLAWIAREVTAPLAADPVSAAKAARLKPLLSRLVLLKPNVPEAELLTGLSIRRDSDLKKAADALHCLGVRRVYLSLGARGVWADDPQTGGRLLPCLPGQVVNTTGCGDAFVAAAADAWLDGLGTAEAGRRALAAAAICAGDTEAVSARISRENIDLKLSLPI